VPSARTGNKRIITKIDRRKNGLVDLYFGLEKVSLPLDALTEFYLYIGKEITDLELIKIKKYAQNHYIYEYGKSLLARACYSEKLLFDKLQAKDPEHAASAIRRLKEDGLIDDARYAADYLEAKTAQGYGYQRIVNDLIHLKKVSPSIANALPKENVTVDMDGLVASLEKRFAAYPYQAKKNKSRAWLERRGFDKETVDEALSRLSVPAAKDFSKRFEKDFASYLKKHQRTYNGRELESHMVASLLRKGYPLETIKKKLEEFENEQPD